MTANNRPHTDSGQSSVDSRQSTVASGQSTVVGRLSSTCARRRAVATAAALLLIVGAGLWAAGLTPVSAFWPGPAEGVASAPRLTKISAHAGRRLTTVSIEISEPVAYLANRPDPMTVLLELRNVNPAGVANSVKKAIGLVHAVSLEDAVAADGAAVTRLRIALSQPAAHRVRSKRNLIYVDLDRAFPLASPTAEAGHASVAASPRAAGGEIPKERANVSEALRRGGGVPAPLNMVPAIPRATMIEALRAQVESSGTSLTLTGNGQLVVDSVTPASDGTLGVVLDFPNVRVGTSDDGNVPIEQGPIELVRVTTTGDVPLTRVFIGLSRPVSYRVVPPEDERREFKIVFDDTDRAETSAAGAEPVFMASIGASQPAPLDPIQALTVSPAPTPPMPAMPPVPPMMDVPVRGLGPAGTPSRAPLGAPSAAAAPGIPLATPSAAAARGTPLAQQAAGGAQQPAPPPVPPGTQAIGGAQRAFTGDPVNLDFQGADLRAVLRTFAEISGLNIVIDPAVQGTVDVALREVPWDQALDIILRANKLSYVIDGTIVRIAPLNVLADEEAQRRKLSDEQALSGELQVLTRPLSYAKAAELIPLLTNTALSSRGDIQIDARTNTIIIRDLAARLQTVVELINTLDRAQPQVEIEARIVTTTRDFARNLGVQWGFNGRVAPDLANTTGLTFPNQGSLTTGVNLGVESAPTAIGLALGSVNGALDLDAALSALERSGQGRVLSTPRVTTQNNVLAQITQGLQIPIQTVANNTVTVTFKDAALTLQVVPQITAANTVIMQITVDNGSPDFSRAINGIPPIDTQRAITQVLVGDGQTTVIGGIYVSQEQVQSDRTPGLHRIPILGWLFRRQSLSDQSRELLIFITPRIIKT